MIDKIKKLLVLLKEPRVTRILGTFRFHGFLADTGWLQSLIRRVPSDAGCLPLPWASYPFI